MTFPVYVAAPFADGAFVREHVHPLLEQHGITPTSTWVHAAHGPEDFARFAPDALAAAAEQNDHDIHRSAALLVIARHGAGGEMFAEARYALALRKPVIWVGRLILSAWRPGVERVEDLDGAVHALLRRSAA